MTDDESIKMIHMVKWIMRKKQHISTIKSSSYYGKKNLYQSIWIKIRQLGMTRVKWYKVEEAKLKFLALEIIQNKLDIVLWEL